MCRRVTCSTCGRPDWAGCGAHVDAVLADVPPSDRCRCREEGKRLAPKTLGQLVSGWFKVRRGDAS